MPSEDTDLERRVLAHERILKALLTQLAVGSPGFLDRMNAEFGLSPGDQRQQHDYTGTAEHADEFMRHVTGASSNRLSRASPKVRDVATPQPQDVPDTSAPFDEDGPTTFRVMERHGIWQVTRDEVFYGDYRVAQHAVEASTEAALKIRKQGGAALIQFG